jgi:hypothetical protein
LRGGTWLGRLAAALDRELRPARRKLSRMTPEPSVRIGDRVSFRISDVFLPEPAEVLATLTPDTEANGVVVEFSDSGRRPRAYALVRITTCQSVLLPVAALRVGACGAEPAVNEDAV